MAKIMRVGGKSPSNTAVGMAVDANGAVFNKRIWETVVENVANFQPRDTTAVYYPSDGTIDLTGYGIIGLRIVNNLDQAMNITLSDGSNYLATLDESTIAIQVPGSGRSTIVTGDDIPLLNVIPALKLKCQAADTPTEGFIDIKVIKKR